MNQWGAVKLGLAVMTAGAFGLLSTRGATKSPAAERSTFNNFAAPQIQSMVSGAAANLDEGAGFSAGGGGFDKLSKASAMRGAGLSASARRDRIPGAPAGAVRKIVRNASLCFEVKDQAKARALVHGVVLREGAEIFSEESSGSGDNESGTIVIQAAPERLDAIIKALEPLGRVVSRSLSSENMSEEYVDLKSRLDNDRKVEARLTELMQFKTNKLADVLTLERELERVGSQIEQTVGRMKYIDGLAASSHLTVRMAQPLVAQAQEAAHAPGILAEIRNSFVGSFNTFVRTGLSLLNLTGFVLALGLWTLPVAGALWLLKKRFAQ